MDIPFLCVFLAFIFNYLTKVPLAIAMAQCPGGYNNHQPRDQQATLSGWGKRALGAHLNGFECFPAFAAAVIMAHISGVSGDTFNWLCIGFLVSRVIYTMLYLADINILRSLVWGAGMFCVGWIFVLAIY